MRRTILVVGLWLGLLVSAAAQTQNTFSSLLTNALEAAPPYTGTDIIPLVRGGVTFRVPATAIGSSAAIQYGPTILDIRDYGGNTLSADNGPALTAADAAGTVLGGVQILIPCGAWAFGTTPITSGKNATLADTCVSIAGAAEAATVEAILYTKPRP